MQGFDSLRDEMFLNLIAETRGCLRRDVLGIKQNGACLISFPCSILWTGGCWVPGATVVIVHELHVVKPTQTSVNPCKSHKHLPED